MVDLGGGRVGRSRRRDALRGASRASLLALLAALAAGAATAADNPFGYGSGTPWIFQSGYGSVDDDPGFDHFTRVLPVGTTTLHLYATAGSQPSSGSEGASTCLPGASGADGDEICGMDVQINVAGPAYVSGFRAASGPGGSGIVFAPTSFSPTTKSLRLNSVRSEDPIPAGAHAIGELDVTVTGGSGVVVTVSGNAMVLAQRSVANVEPNIIAVPEPGRALLLGSALVGLAALAGLRRLRAA